MAELDKIEAEPVNLEAATAADLKKLRANSTDKVLLINFWATWCGPCMMEFPDFETTYRMFRGRDFDLVMVSTNLPDERAGVMKALEKQHASSRNLQFASDDTYAMQAAFDAKWESGVPYTVVLAPGGKLLYEKTRRGGHFEAAPDDSGQSARSRLHRSPRLLGRKVNYLAADERGSTPIRNSVLSAFISVHPRLKSLPPWH